MMTSLRVVRSGLLPRTRIGSPSDAYRVLRPLARGLDREHFWRLDLDSRDSLLGCELVAVGTIDAALVHPREVFKGAFLNNAVRIVVAHNHPSQVAKPSRADRELTRQLAFAGWLLQLELADHLVVTDDDYFSFKKARLI